jgi:hypothetical protein
VVYTDRSVSPQPARYLFDWDELLLLIEDRAVVPVVGRELLLLPPDYGGVALEQYVANRLAEELQVSLADLSPAPDMNEVAVAYLRDAGVKAETRKRLIQKRVEAITAERSWDPPEPLKQLAAITDFDLFVNTTTDSLLRQALDAVRFDGAGRTKELAYYTRRTPDDVPPSPRAGGDAFVYQLFGNVASSIDFSVTDEDRIETLHRLQDSRLQPPNLFDELREKNLLFLGCGFPDGLSRILVRTLTNKRLFGSTSRNKVADSRATGDSSLSLFLQHCGAEIYVAGSAADFTAQLLEKWQKRAAPVSAPASPRQSDSRSAAAPTPSASFIFLSYKREDMARVGRLKDALERAGMEVWFDQQDLTGGDDWDQKIEKGIENCTLFLPVISRSAQTAEGEFRREWTRALRRAERIPREVPFLIATLIDANTDLRRGDGPTPLLIPEEFWKKQFIQCLDQDPTDAFVQTVKTQMRQAQLLRSGL